MPVLEWREAARADLLAIVDHISEVRIDAVIHDVVNQLCYVQHVLIGEKGI